MFSVSVLGFLAPVTILKRIPLLASSVINSSTEIKLWKIRMRFFLSFGVLRQTLCMCEHKRAVRFAWFFLTFLPSESCELHQPVVLLSRSQLETGHPFAFYLSLSLSLSASFALLASIPNSVPVFFFFFSVSFFSPAVSPPRIPHKCQKCSVRRTRRMCHMNQYFCC